MHIAYLSLYCILYQFCTLVCCFSISNFNYCIQDEENALSDEDDILAEEEDDFSENEEDDFIEDGKDDLFEESNKSSNLGLLLLINRRFNVTIFI